MKIGTRTFVGLALILPLTANVHPAHADAPPKAIRACVACHTFEKGGQSKIGPNLYGIFGQKATAVAGFDKYGTDMKSAAEKGLSWTAANLSAYIENPIVFLKTATGSPSVRTNMIARVRKPADREAIITYLKSLKD
ncbi:MAG: c-type cytochrome [Rhodospirillaceae bacterium]|nr:c-type cytochrome [Rhodospirillaceae bacterium]